MNGQTIMLRGGSWLVVFQDENKEISHGANFSKQYLKTGTLGAAAAKEKWKDALVNSPYKPESLEGHIIEAFIDVGDLNLCRDLACSEYGENFDEYESPYYAYQ